MVARSDRAYVLLEEADVSEPMLVNLFKMVGCPSCGAEPGELCHRGWLDRAHQERWLAAQDDVSGKGRCRQCRFVAVTPGKVSDSARNGRHDVEKSSGYFCRRFPPRRSLGHEYHLTEVDPLGWCGEFRLAGWLRDRQE